MSVSYEKPRPARAVLPAAPGHGTAITLHVEVKLDMEKVGKMQVEQVLALFEGIAKVLNAQRPNLDYVADR